MHDMRWHDNAKAILNVFVSENKNSKKKKKKIDLAATRFFKDDIYSC